ncbi:MAG: DUF4430 domain-containing protein [bacterium]|nr:DUF4430 domain-containing protein [bacterium]
MNKKITLLIQIFIVLTIVVTASFLLWQQADPTLSHQESSGLNKLDNSESYEVEADPLSAEVIEQELEVGAEEIVIEEVVDLDSASEYIEESISETSVVEELAQVDLSAEIDQDAEINTDIVVIEEIITEPINEASETDVGESNDQEEEFVETITVQLTASGPGVSYNFALDVTAGDTAEDVMLTARKEGFKYSATNFPGLGNFVESIGGVSSDEKAGIYWKFYINNSLASAGISSQKVFDGDVIGWKFEK